MADTLSVVVPKDAWLLSLVLLLSVIACSSDDRHPAAPSPQATVAFEQQTHTKVNEYRVARGLPALGWSEVIADLARQHSQGMASGLTSFGHDGFESRMATIALTIPWSGAAENVAVNRTVAAAVDGWLSSAAHRENIEGSFDLTGIGTAPAKGGDLYFTQIFIRSR